MRIFSSEVYLRHVADLTRRTKDLVCSARSSAASGLPTDDWVTPAPFSGNSTLCPGARTTLPLSGFPALRCVRFSLTVYKCDYKNVCALFHDAVQCIDLERIFRYPTL